MKLLLLVLAICAGTTTSVRGDSTPGFQSFESCSLITSEYITVLQLVHRGFSPEELEAALPALSEKGQKRMQTLFRAVESSGLPETYSAVNSEYARCAKAVFDRTGKPGRATREGHFYFCAGENKVRYEILMAAMVGAREDTVVNQLADRHKPLAAAIFSFYRKHDAMAVFDTLSDELKFCINNNL